MSAGKGDKLRKGANLEKYWQNYDTVFAPKLTFIQWQKHFEGGNVLQDADAPPNADEVMTEQQYKQILNKPI